MDSPRLSGWEPADHFEIRDIALWDARLERSAQVLGSADLSQLRLEGKRQIRWDVLEATVGVDEQKDVLRAYVRLRLAAYPPGVEIGTSEPYFLVEATFAAEYIVTGELPKEQQLVDFVGLNVTRACWPFWRQHVYDTLKRASLPLIAVPLFTGEPGAFVKKKEPVRRVKR